MLRTSWRFLCAAGASQSSRGYGQREFADDPEDEGPKEEERAFVKPGGYGMDLASAYRMFGYKMGDAVSKADVKTRFNALAKKAHPDLGGTEKEFMQLMEAQKLLLHHSHGPKTTSLKSKKERKVTFTRQSHASIFKSVTWENAEEHRQVIPVDYAIALFLGCAFFYSYYSYLTHTVTKASDGRSRMNTEEVKALNEAKLRNASHAWHPWKASTETREHVTEIEEARRARLEQKQAAAAAAARTPWGA